MGSVLVPIEGSWQDDPKGNWKFMGMLLHELGEKAPTVLKVGGMIYRLDSGEIRFSRSRLGGEE